MTGKRAKAQRANTLSAAGFPAAQQAALTQEFGTRPDVAKIGIADATDLDSAIKLANACKARLNQLIGATKDVG